MALARRLSSAILHHILRLRMLGAEHTPDHSQHVRQDRRQERSDRFGVALCCAPRDRRQLVVRPHGLGHGLPGWGDEPQGPFGASKSHFQPVSIAVETGQGQAKIGRMAGATRGQVGVRLGPGAADAERNPSEEPDHAKEA